jgi:hypothetical protein
MTSNKQRWWLAFLAVLLACWPIYANRAESSMLLRDTDTDFLLKQIELRSDPWSWFAGDWPLQNHFYRPISTLTFELDFALHGLNAAGYGLTNAVVCILCVWALFWFARELTDDPFLSAGCAVLFAIWHVDYGGYLAQLAIWIAPLVAFFGLCRHGFQFKQWLGAPLVLWYLSDEIAGKMGLYGRMVAWLPGRTASVMALFALIALAAYARYERTGAEKRLGCQPSPLDPPSTKSSEIKIIAKSNILWMVVSAVGLLAALGSYEQAVMVPGILFGIAVYYKLNGYKVRWGWQGLFWGILVGYLVVRSRLVPTEASGYQLQQFRDGIGVLWSLMAYIAPGIGPLYNLFSTLDVGPLLWLTSGPYRSIAFAAGNAIAYWNAAKQWLLPFSGWVFSLLAFLPMAWLKHFEHYHYWPMALRSLFVVAMVLVALQLTKRALAPPASLSPPRLAPALGSLPRR